MTSRPSKAVLLKSTFTGLTAQYINAAATGMIQIGLLAVLARLLTPTDYGLMGLAVVFTSLSGVLSQFGLGVAIVQRLSPGSTGTPLRVFRSPRRRPMPAPARS